MHSLQPTQSSNSVHISIICQSGYPWVDRQRHTVCISQWMRAGHNIHCLLIAYLLQWNLHVVQAVSNTTYNSLIRQYMVNTASKDHPNAGFIWLIYGDKHVNVVSCIGIVMWYNHCRRNSRWKSDQIDQMTSGVTCFSKFNIRYQP